MCLGGTDRPELQGTTVQPFIVGETGTAANVPLGTIVWERTAIVLSLDLAGATLCGIRH
jgi:hypothetical protein